MIALLLLLATLQTMASQEEKAEVVSQYRDNARGVQLVRKRLTLVICDGDGNQCKRERVVRDILTFEGDLRRGAIIADVSDCSLGSTICTTGLYKLAYRLKMREGEFSVGKASYKQSCSNNRRGLCRDYRVYFRNYEDGPSSDGYFILSKGFGVSRIVRQDEDGAVLFSLQHQSGKPFLR